MINANDYRKMVLKSLNVIKILVFFMFIMQLSGTYILYAIAWVFCFFVACSHENGYI